MTVPKSILVLLPFVAVSPAFGQSRGWELTGEPRYSFIVILAGNKPIQEELTLSAEQSKSIDDLWEEIGGAFMFDVREDLRKQEDEKRGLWQDADKKAEEAMHKILSPRQIARLKQLTLQAQGSLALRRADVVEKLGLTEDQLKRFLEIEAAHQRPSDRPFNPKEFQRLKLKEIRQLSRVINERSKAIFAEMLDVLTDEQRAKWEEMNGDRLKFFDQAPTGAPTPTADRPEPAKKVSD
jgi:hypothetical protein